MNKQELLKATKEEILTFVRGENYYCNNCNYCNDCNDCDNCYNCRNQNNKS